jgi:hypothetical protein
MFAIKFLFLTCIVDDPNSRAIIQVLMAPQSEDTNNNALLDEIKAQRLQCCFRI